MNKKKLRTWLLRIFCFGALAIIFWGVATSESPFNQKKFNKIVAVANVTMEDGLDIQDINKKILESRLKMEKTDKGSFLVKTVAGSLVGEISVESKEDEVKVIVSCNAIYCGKKHEEIFDFDDSLHKLIKRDISTK